MNEFEESKHPRADDGKFTNGLQTNLPHSDLDKALSALGEVDEKRRKDSGTDLSKKEWAMFYERIGKIKREGYYVPKTKKGEMLISIETEEDNMLVIATGSYQKPKVKASFRIEDKDELYKIISIMEGR